MPKNPESITGATAPDAAPVLQSDRISILDSLRGFAILGILLMNISSFAMPVSGYDPTLLNETGINYYTWYFIMLVPFGTQRALFSMLFGAGIILFINGRDSKKVGSVSIEYFFRRQLWLIVFSVFDVWVLLWHGDILLDYALLGMLMVAFRNLPPKKLFIGAAVCLSFMTIRTNLDLYNNKKLISRGESIASLDTSVHKLNDIQKADLNAMLSFKESATREAKIKKRELAMLKVQEYNYDRLHEEMTSRYTGTLVQYLYFELWDVLLFMFIGMAFFKLGILTGEAPIRVYIWMCGIGLTFGLFLMNSRLQVSIQNGFNAYNFTKDILFDPFEPGRLFRSLGIYGFIMLLYKSGLFNWLFLIMRAPGQMAFTNYLMQSAICAIIFYGIGFGLYGKLPRIEVYGVVGLIWLFQIIFSHIWLRYFRFGPLEWLWRSLTYWKIQPIRK
jgi:uncharacterized protein